MLSATRIATRQASLRTYRLRTTGRAASAWSQVAQGPPVSGAAIYLEVKKLTQSRRMSVTSQWLQYS
jgi:hypothetical protein